MLNGLKMERSESRSLDQLLADYMLFAALGQLQLQKQQPNRCTCSGYHVSEILYAKIVHHIAMMGSYERMQSMCIGRINFYFV